MAGLMVPIVSVPGGRVQADREQAGTASAAADVLTPVYRAHFAGLVRLSALLLDDAVAAEEIVQDAFVDLHPFPSDPDVAASALRRLVLRRSRRLLRRRRVASALLPVQRAAEPADVPVLAALEHEEILRNLSGLPTRQREVLVLRYYGGLSEAEIADTMGVSRGSVKTHASRGLAALRAALEH